MSQIDNSLTDNFLVNRFGDTYLYDVNRNTFDQLGSATLFARHFGRRFEGEDRMNIVVGSDSGLLIRYVHEKGIPPGSRFVFIEPDELIPVIERQLADLDWSDKVRLTTRDDWGELAERFSFQDYAYLGNLEVIQSFAAMDAYLPEYRGIHRDVKSDIETFIWQVQFRSGSEAFIEKQIENMVDNRVQASLLRDSFSGQTAVVLGGGPSLDDIIPWIREHREDLIVIAVSRIARRLLMDDLQPDIVVSIDPHPVSFDVSKEMLRFDRDVLLVNSYHITPLLLGQWRGRSAYLGARFPWETKLNGQNLAAAGPNVTNTALVLAIDMGFSRILLGGVDLCYTRSGETYASGSNEREVGPFLGALGVQVETNGGWMADTRHSFASSVEIMGQQAAAAVQKGCTLINPAPGAAKIPNVEHQALDSLDITPPGESPRRTLAALLPVEGREERLAAYDVLARELARANGRLRKIRELSLEALHCNDGLWGRKGIKADFKYKKRMDKIERKLDREFKDYSPLVKQFGSRTFLRLVRPDRDKEWSDEEIEYWGRAYYESYRDASDALLGLVEKQQEELRLRRLEESATPDIAALLEHWEQHDIPGRAALWLAQHKHSIEHLDADLQDRFRALAEQLDATLDTRETAHLARCRDEFSLASVRSKAQILLLNNEQDELQQLVDGLNRVDGDEAAELFHLASGYLCELQDQAETALAHYQQVTDSALAAINAAGDGERPRNPRLEDALRRMSGITLAREDIESALLVMDSLAALAPAYEPQYAELLRLSGNLPAAIDVYTDYLKKAPRDYGTMLKLGRLYQSMGVTESARWAYNFVVESDPDNTAAKALLAQLEETTG